MTEQSQSPRALQSGPADLVDVVGRFTITWNCGAYRVSIPNYLGGEVVRAASYDALSTELERERERAEKFMWQVRDTCARAEAAESRASRLEGALKQHHDWHLQSGPIGLPDGAGGWIEIDNALEYSESRMCEETQALLAGLPAPELEPMPRGGINAWWWQIAVVSRREIRKLKAELATRSLPVNAGNTSSDGEDKS